jgi:hypothetical protein
MRPRGRRRLALAATAAGCALAVASGVQLADARSPRELPRSFDSAVAAPSTGVAPTTAASSAAPSGLPGRADVLPPASGGDPAPLVQVPAPVSTPPAHVSVPALRIDAAIAPVADTHTGIQVPSDVDTVGWWVAGASPQDPAGTTVLVGHVDAYDQGPGALYHLDGARPGTPVAVTTADGQVTRYAVTALQVVRKRAGLPASLFAQDVAPRLVLITCGGPFDDRTRQYLDNIVVTAVPVP